MRKDEVRHYYDCLKAVDIGMIARELFAQRITSESRTELQVDCPHHPSASKASLRVSLHEGLWTCFGCRVGGDVLQLVEFVQFHVVTSGRTSPMPDTHRAARDWLAQRAGLPTLAEVAGLDAVNLEQSRARDEAVFGALTDLARIQHDALMRDPEIVEWTRAQWGFTPEVLKRFQIGLSGSDGELDLLEKAGHELGAIVACGAYYEGRSSLVPFFRGRVMFPYFSGGRVVYMIGRQCPRTPDEVLERAKYKKLPRHDEKAHPLVSPAIDHGALWGEDILLGKPDLVLFMEGVTDAISAQFLDFPTISPVTVKLRKDDIDRIVRKTRNVKRVVMLLDNEWSGIGESAGVANAMLLCDAGVACSVASLPLGDRQKRARAELAALIGEQAVIEAHAAPAAQRKKIALAKLEADPQALARAETLLKESKIDVAEWVRDGGTAEQLAAIANSAAHPAIFAARSLELPDSATEEMRIAAARQVLDLIATTKPLERQIALRALKDRLKIPLRLLEKETNQTRREQRENPGAKPVSIPPPTAEEGTCAAAVKRAIATFRSRQSPIEWEEVGETIYRWFVEHGGRFFKTRAGEPCLFWRNQLFRLNSSDQIAKNEFIAMLYRETHKVPLTTGMKTAVMVLAALATDHGKTVDEFSWIHADFAKCVVWMATGNDRHEILRVSPDGVDVMPNGINRDQVILRCDSAFTGFEFDRDANVDTLDADLEKYMGRHMACSPIERRILLDWTCCFPLLLFAGTRPMVRLEGPAGSGKTLAAKFITTMVFGSTREKKATDAANYSDASRNPLVSLDNIETENVTPQLRDFLLTAITGIVKQKRASGSDTALIEERPQALILSTGIEPLGAELEEILSRAIVIDFEARLQRDGGMVESRELGLLAAERPRILSAILKRCSIVLKLIRDHDGQARVMAAIKRRMGEEHGKRRCDDFLALMYLQRVASAPESEREAMLDSIDPDFARAIELMNAATSAIAREASPIVLPLEALFTSFRSEDDARKECGLRIDSVSDGIVNATAREIFLALRKISRDRNVPFGYRNPTQFAKRLSAAIDLLKSSGFSVDISKNRAGTRLYSIAPPRERGQHVAEQGDLEFSSSPDADVDEREDLSDNAAAEALERQFGSGW